MIKLFKTKYSIFAAKHDFKCEKLKNALVGSKVKEDFVNWASLDFKAVFLSCI